MVFIQLRLTVFRLRGVFQLPKYFTLILDLGQHSDLSFSRHLLKIGYEPPDGHNLQHVLVYLLVFFALAFIHW